MWTVMPSPVGDLRIVERDGSIVAIEFFPFRPPANGRPLGDRADDRPVLLEAVRQLTAYFGRQLTDFDLPLAPVGTDFQRRVWEQICCIPVGATATYGELARRLHAEARAVGQACGDNRLPLAIPCHRVVAASGIGGFAHHRGGAYEAIKRWLLLHEAGSELRLT